MKMLPFILAIALSLHGIILAQDTNRQKEIKKQQAVAQLIGAKRYSFVPQIAIPSRGPSKTLTTDYLLKVKTDTLEAYLPYFGRAYSATVGLVENPLDFKTTEFTYSSNDDKKGGWNITIMPKNAGDARKLILSVSKDGYASLQVVCNNREPISFNGYIQ